MQRFAIVCVLSLLFSGCKDAPISAFGSCESSSSCDEGLFCAKGGPTAGHCTRSCEGDGECIVRFGEGHFCSDTVCVQACGWLSTCTTRLVTEFAECGDGLRCRAETSSSCASTCAVSTWGVGSRQEGIVYGSSSAGGGVQGGLGIGTTSGTFPGPGGAFPGGGTVPGGSGTIPGTGTTSTTTRDAGRPSGTGTSLDAGFFPFPFFDAGALLDAGSSGTMDAEAAVDAGQDAASARDAGDQVCTASGYCFRCERLLDTTGTCLDADGGRIYACDGGLCTLLF